MRSDKEKALSALLTSETKAEAAQKAGISDRTLRTYLSDPAFKAEYQKRKKKLLSDATHQIQQSMKIAVSTLRGIIQSKSSKDSDRITASRLILEFGLRYTEINDLLSRLEDLENTINQNNESR